MKIALKKFFSDPIFRHGGVIFASSMFVNVFNLVFWLYMVRKLSPEDYGVLNSLVSLLMFFSVPTGILQTVVTRYTSKLMAQDHEAQVRFLFFYFVKIVAFFAAGILIFFILFAHSISGFLRIDERSLVAVCAIGIGLSSFAPVTMGLLYGLQKFNDIALNSMATGIAKLGVGFSLVAAGLKTFGALVGFVVSFAVTLVYSFLQLPRWLKGRQEKMDHAVLDRSEIYRYFLPVGLGTMSFFALTNMDIILVKHFFSPVDAGYYSVAQMVGKIILFIPGAIGVVMFPKVVDSHIKTGSSLFILKKCLIAVGALCGVGTFCALLFPSLILKILTGHTQPEAVELVKFFAVSMTFFALVSILTLYHLSLHRVKYIYTLTFVAIAQFLAIWFFHANLSHVIFILLVASLILFYAGLRDALGSRGRE